MKGGIAKIYFDKHVYNIGKGETGLDGKRGDVLQISRGVKDYKGGGG